MNLQPSCFVARKVFISLGLTSRNKDGDTMKLTEIIINDSFSAGYMIGRRQKHNNLTGGNSLQSN